MYGRSRWIHPLCCICYQFRIRSSSLFSSVQLHFLTPCILISGSEVDCDFKFACCVATGICDAVTRYIVAVGQWRHCWSVEMIRWRRCCHVALRLGALLFASLVLFSLFNFSSRVRYEMPTVFTDPVFTNTDGSRCRVDLSALGLYSHSLKS